jgi:hypothetical protein
MEKEFLFALLSTGIYLVGAIPYWIDLIRGRTTPHIFTYGLWWILVAFNVFVLLKNSEYYALIPSGIMFASLTWAVIYGLFVWEKIQINWFDWACLSLWILLVIYWFSSENILNTVILTLIIDLIAFLPTFKKWWIAPWTESILIYFMSAIGQIATLLSLSGFQNIENALFEPPPIL